MSGAFGSSLAGLGGTKVAALIVAGGLVAGGLGGGLASGLAGGGGGGGGEGALPVYACPDSGEPLIKLANGQRLLVTGRTEDSGWLRIHFPLPGRTEAWVQSTPLTVTGDVSALPVAECAPEEARATDGARPEPTLTAIVNATPSPAPETEAPSGTPVPTPAVTALTASAKTISYDTGTYCPTDPKSVVIKTTVTSVAGATGVTLSWRKPGASTFAETAMTLASGNASQGTWQATLDTTANGLTTAGTLSYYAEVTDAAGSVRRLPAKGTGSITIAVCENVGPVITASSSSGSSLYEDPLFVGTCQTATNILAVIKDPDGVASATLFYKVPGSKSFAQKGMDGQQIKGKWYANLDTLGDQISILSPPSDPLQWYVKAFDKKGVAAQTKTFTTTVKRCDTEAVGKLSVGITSYNCSSIPVSVIGYLSDRDSSAGTLGVVYHWTVTDQYGKSVSGTASGVYAGRAYYAQFAVDASGLSWNHFIYVYAVTTDTYGGTTKGYTQDYNQNCG